MLLAVDPWPGTLIHDEWGDVFSVDLDAGMALQFIDTTDEVMSDMAFSPEGHLYGVTLPWWGDNSVLYSFLSDFESFTPSIETEWIREITLGATQPLYLNALTFSPDGELFAAGSKFPDPHSNPGFLFKIDLDTGAAEQVLSFGSYSSSGDLAFDSHGNLYLTARSGELLRVPPEQDSFDVVGDTGIGRFYGVTFGPGPLFYGFTWDEEVYRIDMATGESTLVVQFTDPWLDYVNGAATVFPAPTDLGEVDFRELLGQEPTLGEFWYRVELTHGAILTVEVANADPASDLSLTLYEFDDDGQLVELETGDARLDYEGALDFNPATDEREFFVQIEGAASDFDVRIANLFRPTANGAIVYGTEEDDTFEFVPGPPYTMTINGVGYAYNFSSSSLVEVSFDGDAGHDQATLTGSALDDVATLDLATFSGTVTRSPRYEVQVFSTEEIDFDGGLGDDSATLIGSGLADTITMEPGAASVLGQGGARVSTANTPTIEIDGGPGADSATFTGTSAKETVELRPLEAHFGGTGFSTSLANVETVSAVGGGGEDEALLYDSPGADTFTAGPGSAEMSNSGFTLAVNGFPTVYGYASDDGHTDTAVFDDLPGGGDRFRSWSTEAKMSGTGFVNRAKGFDQVVAGASDPADVAELNDSAGSDSLEAYADRGTMTYAGGQTVQANAFRWLYAFASDDGHTDTARFYDTTVDLGTSYATWFQGELDASKMYYGSVFFNRAKGFDHVIASAVGANDRARLYDSPGADAFEAHADSATMSYAGGSTVRADGIRWLFAFASDDGQTDTAHLYDTTADLGTSYATWFKGFHGTAKMYEASTFYNRADDFDQVVATAVGSNDTAKLYDSPGADALETYADQATMSYPDGTVVRADDFRWVLGYASDDGQVDTAQFYDTTADLGTSYATWFKADDQIARLYDDSVFYVQARDFDGASATAVGDDDTAKLFDSALDDAYWSRPDHSRMDYADGTFAEALDFRYMQGYSLYGTDTATLYDETSGGTSYAARFAGYATWAKLFSGAAFYSRTEGFAELRAALGGGDDLAWVYDDPARVDHLIVPFLGDMDHAAAKAQLFNAERAIYIDDFHTLTATTSQNFVDDKDVDLAYEDDVVLVGDWAEA